MSIGDGVGILEENAACPTLCDDEDRAAKHPCMSTTSDPALAVASFHAMLVPLANGQPNVVEDTEAEEAHDEIVNCGDV